MSHKPLPTPVQAGFLLRLAVAALGGVAMQTAASVPSHAAQTPDQTAFFNIQAFSIKDLQDFVAAYPNSQYVSDAQGAIALLSDFDAIRKRTKPPGCEIKFADLGHYNDGTPAWANASKVNPKRGASGFFISGNSAGIFSPVPGKGLSVWLGNNQMPVWPAGDGSIWGIDTDGNTVWLYPGLKIQTHSRVLLGVIADRGIVCISGMGSLIYTDGRTVAFGGK
ncbi:MAG TPA: hypothetical protein VGG99_10890 [Acetobacteraceae bacterium]|jgi:hypothetical protein